MSWRLCRCGLEFRSKPEGGERFSQWEKHQAWCHGLTPEEQQVNDLRLRGVTPEEYARSVAATAAAVAESKK